MRIRQRLTEFGLAGFEIALIVARTVEGKPMLQIVKEQGWVSSSSANYHLKQTLAKLRRGGFKL